LPVLKYIRMKIRVEMSQIRLELKISRISKTIIKIVIIITFTQIKATLVRIQAVSTCGFILISMRIAKIRTPRLARFGLYN